MQDQSDQVRDFGARRSSVAVKLVDDQGEAAFWESWFMEPPSGLIENGFLELAHEHDVQHAVVRDEDVRRGVLHVPA